MKELEVFKTDNFSSLKKMIAFYAIISSALWNLSQFLLYGWEGWFNSILFFVSIGFCFVFIAIVIPFIDLLPFMIFMKSEQLEDIYILSSIVIMGLMILLFVCLNVFSFETFQNII